MTKTQTTRISTFQPNPREFAGLLTIDDFCTCRPNLHKKYEYTNKELEIRAKFYEAMARGGEPQWNRNNTHL